MLVLINTLPADVRVWVQEHKPKTSEAAAQLADDYLQARKPNPLAASEERPIVCAKCSRRVNLDGIKTEKTERTRRDLNYL